MTTPELLAPAGSADALRAALAAGADAVYFGSTAFSNRMRARNFADSDMSDAIRLCHDCGAKAYITVNTRVRDREADDLCSLCDLILGSSDESARCDAVICADFGVARMIRSRWPHAVLHASTQTSLSSPSDCSALRSLGFSRLVVPRELSKEEIAALVRDSGFEIEMFLHGAHCVSLSGQCLASFVMGGRSGNRGDCAQPCRLPYRLAGRVAEPCPLSLADMCLAGDIPALLSTGVTSLKLEGRLKSAPYVYGVTSVYRRLLDERRAADKAELEELAGCFTRGFTDGYFVRRYRSMSGKEAAEGRMADPAPLIRSGLSARLNEYRSVRHTAGQPVRARLTVSPDIPVSLTLICGGVSRTASGVCPSPATGRPVDADAAFRSVSKLGDTGFSLDPADFEADIAPDLWLPVSALNALRRDAAALLTEALSENSEKKTESLSAADIPDVPARPASVTLRSAEFFSPDMLAEAARETPEALAALFSRFDRVTLPAAVFADRASGSPACLIPGSVECAAALPPLLPSDNDCRSLLASFAGTPVRRILCHTPGQLALAREAGFEADASFRANLTNADAIAVWFALGASSVTLSPELPAGAVRALGSFEGRGAIVYGRIPVMTLSRCLISGGSCRKGNVGGRIPLREAKPHVCRDTLTDRRGEEFPVFGQPDCTNVIFNSVPVAMSDRMDQLGVPGFAHFLFTVESVRECAAVLDAYDSAAPLAGRRL